MKKSIKVKATMERKYAAVGLDVSDRKSAWVAIGDSGEVTGSGKVTTRTPEMESWARAMPSTLIALEAGPHSPWISRLLTRCGHEVIVANPAKVPSISRSQRKTDWRDAEHLARLARFDRSLLHEIRHRSEQTQKDLQVVRSRDAAVRARTKLINHIRGTMKAYGHVPPRCSADAFVLRVQQWIPEELKEVLTPIVEATEKVTAVLRGYDKQIERLAATRYPDSKWLMQIPGVGALTALTFILVLEDATRFRTSRPVGAYLGMVPAKDQSGESDPEKGISKEGDRLLRRLLVQCAHYILGPFGIDSDLRRHGQSIAQRGGKKAKKRAAIAVARKLSVVLHRLWITKATYIPLHKLDRMNKAVA